MTIHQYRSDDASAIRAASGHNPRHWVTEILLSCLVTGYGAKSGQGWTVIHDSRATDGHLAIEDPDGQVYVFEYDPGSATKLYGGMAQAADAAGNLTHYRSGTYCNTDGLGDKAGIDSGRYQMLDKWVLLYDDATHAFALRGGWDYYVTYQYWDDGSIGYQLTLFGGPIKGAGSYSPKCLFMGDTTLSYSNPNFLSSESVRGTCLYWDDGVLSYSGECPVLFLAASYNLPYVDAQITIPVPSRLHSQEIAVLKDDGSGYAFELLGTLRGYRQCFPRYRQGYDKKPDRIAEWLDPTAYASDDPFQNPVSLNGSDYYIIMEEQNTGFVLWMMILSNSSEWW